MQLCPKCSNNNAVKNGKVRGQQRYCCRACGFNYAAKYKHRWSHSEKLVNLLLYRSGNTISYAAKVSGATVQTVSRWLQEAKYEHPWFVQILAEYKAFSELSMGAEEALAKTQDLYRTVVDNPRRDLMGRVGDSPLWAEALRYAKIKISREESCVFGDAWFAALLSGFDVAKARDMIRVGQASPPSWQPWIETLRFSEKFRNLPSRLEELDLSRTPVSDLAPLAGLSRLRRLYLGGTPVSDLAPLAGLTWLWELDLGGTPVSDLAPLAGLTGLERLDLSGTPVSDLAPLAGLTELKELDLSRTPVSDLAPLAGVSRLCMVKVESEARWAALRARLEIAVRADPGRFESGSKVWRG